MFKKTAREIEDGILIFDITLITASWYTISWSIQALSNALFHTRKVIASKAIVVIHAVAGFLILLSAVCIGILITNSSIHPILVHFPIA